MPLVCRYKPNRTAPRLIRASDAARFICGALDNPEVTQALIEEQLEERGCNWDRGNKDCEDRKRQAVQAVMRLVEENNQVIAIAQGALSAILAQLLVLAGLISLVPIVGGPANRSVVAIRTGVAALRTRVTVQKAANDDIFRLVSNL